MELFIGLFALFLIYAVIETASCDHEFYGFDLKSRDKNGNVSWKCCKCDKNFIQECGLDVLRHGECRGGWLLSDEKEIEEFKKGFEK